MAYDSAVGGERTWARPLTAPRLALDGAELAMSKVMQTEWHINEPRPR